VAQVVPASDVTALTAIVLHIRLLSLQLVGAVEEQIETLLAHQRL
jgi:hypothetical protein